MKVLKIKPLAISLALTALLSFFATPASAVVHIVDSKGQLRGAQNVMVGSAAYDVTFETRSFLSIYGTSAPAISTEPLARAAAQALLDDVLRDIPAGNFDSDPELTYGISDLSRAVIYTPFKVNNTYVSVIESRNASGIPPVGGTDGIPPQVFSTRDFEVLNASDETYAIWTPAAAVAAVPEPSAYALMSLGLLGVVGISRHRRNQG